VMDDPRPTVRADMHLHAKVPLIKTLLSHPNLSQNPSSKDFPLPVS
jgi:hypothetical protein